VILDGVRIEPELAGLVARLLGEGLRRGARVPGAREAGVRRLIAECEADAARSAADSSRGLDMDSVRWVPLPRVALMLGIPERTLRARAAAGTTAMPVRREGRRWLIGMTRR
jgi:hypothetical protein